MISNELYERFEKEYLKQIKIKRDTSVRKFIRSINIFMNGLTELFLIGSCLISILLVFYAGIQLDSPPHFIFLISGGLVIILMFHSYLFFKIFESNNKKERDV